MAITKKPTKPAQDATAAAADAFISGAPDAAAATRPGLLDGLSSLPFAYRWTARWLGLDKVEAEQEIARLRRRWRHTTARASRHRGCRMPTTRRQGR